MPAPHKDAPHWLLVEGDDDQHSIIHFTKRHGVDWDAPDTFTPYVRDCDGFPNLLKEVGVQAKGSRQRLGIVVDADENLADRWKELGGALRAAGCAAPDSLSKLGTIFTGITPDRKVGVWIMPDNETHGNLEEFLTTLVPSGDRIWTHAQSSTERALRLGAPFRPIHRRKAELHSWLAWQEQPGMPFGAAIQRKVFAQDSPVALAFLAWFRRLFWDM
jgi:hypothetical protein